MNNSLLSSLVCSLALVIGTPVGSGQETVDTVVVESAVFDAPVATYTVQGGYALHSVPVPLASYSFGWGGGGMHLLNDPSVMKDLELVDDQKERLADVRKAFSKQQKEVMKEFGKAKNDRERIKELQEEIQAIQQDQSDAMSDVLLPHQLDRIKQVSAQMQMKSMGTAGALQYGALAKELEISDAQKKELLEIQQELQKEIAEATKRLKENAKKQVLSTLSADQRAKLDEMTGQEFKRDPNDWRDRLSKSKPQKTLDGRKKKIKKN